MRVWTYLYSAAKEPEGCGKVTEYCLIAGRKNEDEAASGYDKIKEKRREQSRKSRCFFHKKAAERRKKMKVRKIYAVYFSATGTTEKTVCRASQAAVRTIFSPSGDFDRNEAYKKAADTERPCPCSQKTTGGVQNGENSFENSPAAPVKICFNSPDFRRRNLSFKRGDLVFFGVPVYAGRVPNLLLPYLRESISGGGAAAVPIVSYGNRNFDDALKELAQLLERAGFFTAAGGAFVGEHAFSERAGRMRRIWIWPTSWGLPL